jgi:GNAT superfamily N-acetyltransferase
VLRPKVREQGFITDEHDAHARHWAAFCGDEIVAAARMCIHHSQEDTPDGPAFDRICLPVPVATLNRLVVLPSARNLGLGSRLCRDRIEAAKKEGAMCVVGTCTDSRVASLEGFGFRTTGQHWTPIHAESQVVHAMVLVL